MNYRHWLATGILSCAVLLSPLQAQDQQLTASQWRTRILDAYSKLDRYQVRKQINITQAGRESDQKQQLTLNIAIDRSTKSVAADTQGLRLVGNEGVVRTQMVPDSGRHLRLEDVDPLNPATLERSWPMFPLWLWVPDLSLYLGTEVQLFLKDEGFKFSSRDVQLPENQKEFETTLGQVKMYLTLDTTSSLFRKAQVVTTGKTPDGLDVKTTIDFDMQYSIPKTWDAKTFVFDATNSTPVDSLQKMSETSQDASALEGKAAPAIVLDDLAGEPFDLSKVKSKVVFLDFWATWCGPCLRAMPETIELDQWIKENKLDVSVYTVNLQEEKSMVQKFIKERGWALPVLMDVQGKVAASYRAYSIPQTVIIVDGVVKKVYTGYSPRIATQWRVDINEALGLTP